MKDTSGGTGKVFDYIVKVTVEEYYSVTAKSELQAFMTDLEDPFKIIVKRKKITKRKILKPSNTTDNA